MKCDDVILKRNDKSDQGMKMNKKYFASVTGKIKNFFWEKITCQTLIFVQFFNNKLQEILLKKNI